MNTVTNIRARAFYPAVTPNLNVAPPPRRSEDKEVIEAGKVDHSERVLPRCEYMAEEKAMWSTVSWKKKVSICPWLPCTIRVSIRNL